MVLYFFIHRSFEFDAGVHPLASKGMGATGWWSPAIILIQILILFPSKIRIPRTPIHLRGRVGFPSSSP